MGTTIPPEVNTESLNEFIRIYKIKIFHRDGYLGFSIGIPLVNSEKYTIHPIFLPILYKKNTLILIGPEVNYLALSSKN